jgi:hypothetical protein
VGRKFFLRIVNLSDQVGGAAAEAAEITGFSHCSALACIVLAILRQTPSGNFNS